MNLRLFQWIQTGAGSHPLRDGIAVFFAQAGPYLFMLILIIAWFSSEDSQKSILLEALEASIIGLGFNQMIGYLYFHPRPYMVGLCTPLIPHSPETSFPSDHATLLFAPSIYLLLSRGWRFQGTILFVIAFLVAWGRVYSGIHFPFDMLGSFAVGILGAFLIIGLKSHLSLINRWMIQIYGKRYRDIRSVIRRENRRRG